VKVLEILPLIGSSLKRRFGLARCQMNCVVLADVINEGIRPEASVKIDTGEFCTEASPMCPWEHLTKPFWWEESAPVG
jgi:hypothetical protein